MKKAFFVILFAFLLLGQGNAHASLFTVDAYSNSSSGGVGLDTGMNLTAGQSLIVTVHPNDLWSAGALPRWSNADGLTHNLWASGFDASGEPVLDPLGSILVGKDYGIWTQSGLSAPFGTLVGELGGTFFVIGSNFSGPAPAAGELKLYYWDVNNWDNFGSIVADVDPPTVPEPASWVLLGLGLISMSMFVRRVTNREAARSFTRKP